MHSTAFCSRRGIPFVGCPTLRCRCRSSLLQPCPQCRNLGWCRCLLLRPLVGGDEFRGRSVDLVLNLILNLVQRKIELVVPANELSMFLRSGNGEKNSGRPGIEYQAICGNREVEELRRSLPESALLHLGSYSYIYIKPNCKVSSNCIDLGPLLRVEGESVSRVRRQELTERLEITRGKSSVCGYLNSVSQQHTGDSRKAGFTRHGKWCNLLSTQCNSRKAPRVCKETYIT